MTHPLNLLGKVNIETPAQALEFVRFFSSGQSCEMFDLEGLLDIRADTAVEDWGQDFIARTGLGDIFHEPTAKAMTGTSA